MADLEVVARGKVRAGQEDGFMSQAAEIVRVTGERDTRTLRCDWFVNEEATEFEVHERFPDEQGLVEHQMHIAEPRALLFRDYASDHRSALYGEVSQNFLDLVAQRMGAAPAVFSVVQGLERPVEDADRVGGTRPLEVHAHLRIRPGRLEGFKAQAAEIMRLAREKDTQILRYDWFVDRDGTVCEVHEAYVGAPGLIEHNRNVMDARAVLFERYAYDHRMTAFGEVSQELRALADEHAGGLAVYAFVQGLAPAAAGRATG